LRELIAILRSLELAQQLVGAPASDREEANGYLLWGLVTVFIGVPELLAAFSKPLKADIPWPTISNLVGRDLEAHHHWIAPLIVGLIVLVIVHTLTHPKDEKKCGRALRAPAVEAVHLRWGRRYIVVIAVAGIVAGLVAAAAGASKDELGYAIYLTLTFFGVVVPSALAYWANRVLDLPTLFATLAFLRRRAPWVAALFVALLTVLLFHLALYPWPNYHFG
jgi:hypothetical protein